MRNTSMHKEYAYTYTFGSNIFNVAAHALSLPCTSLRPTEKMFVVYTSWNMLICILSNFRLLLLASAARLTPH